MLVMLGFKASAQYSATVDPSGGGTHTTIQAALNDAPSNATSPYRILIKKGVYYENLTIAKPFIQFIGEDVAKTIITYNNANGKSMPGGGTYGTANSASVIINSDDFSAANVTFENSTGDAPQALAINVSGDRASFKNCRFLGGQDTFLSYNSKYPQSLYKCYIEGVVDFIFGNAKTVFDECVIYPRDRVDNQASSYITASNTRETKGFLFRNCQIIANRGVTKYVLGRPWQNDAATADPKSTAATVFINTKMSNVVKPEGWSIWDAGTDVSKVIYAEYGSMDMNGNPLDVSSRVNWSKQLTSIEAAEYLDNNIVFKDRNNNVWDPYAVFLDGNAVPTNRLAISNFKYTKTGNELTFKWNLNWPENNVTYRLYRIADGGTPTLVNEQTISGNDVNLAYAPTTGKETVPPSMSTYQYYVEATSASGTARSESATIAAIPAITAGTITGALLQGTDGPSATKVYTLSATYLSGNLTVTPPANFQVSNDNGQTWYSAGSPLVITPSSGSVSTTILVRLNTNDATGTYSGNITHTSTNATTVNVAVSASKVNYSLIDLKELIRWELTANNTATAATGVTATTPTFNNLALSDGITVTAVPAYSTTHGQAFGATATGLWGTAAGGPGGNLSRTHYEEFTVVPAAGKMLTVQELLLSTNFYNTSSNTKIGVSYSIDDFTTVSEITGGYDGTNVALANTAFGAFTAPALITNGTSGTTQQFRFILNGDNGVVVPAGKTLKVRLYFSCGSTSSGRYAKLKSVYFKGAIDQQPVNGDFRTIASGSWTDVSIWQKYDGTNWNAVTDYPVYNSGGTSYIEKGHSVILPTLTQGFGYCNNFYVKTGATLTIPSGNTVNFANQSPNFFVDGNFVNSGSIGNNGTYNVKINAGGTFKNAGSLANVGSANFTVAGTYEHAANSNTMPGAVSFEDGSTFLISGITTSQTGILKNTISYYNVTWDNPSQVNYYAFQGNLVSNIRGKFTVNSTGSTYLALLNNSGTIGLGSYEQNGGRVLVRENSTVNAIFNVNGDFVVNGGTFESNSASVKLNLKGATGNYKYNDAGNLLTNLTVDVVGNYTLQSPVASSNLTVENGVLTLGNNSLTVNTITRDNAATGYVITSGTGSLIVKNIGSTSVSVPLGTNLGYSPVAIANTGTSGDFSFSLKSGFDNPLPSNVTKSVNLQWNITPLGSGANANLQFQWTAANHNAGFLTTDPVSVANYHNGAYIGYGATVTGTNPYVATVSGINQFSPFVVINNGVLPLDLIVFEAKKVGTATNPQVNLSWKTTNEVNTLKFELLRKGSQGNFAVINTQASKNTAGEHQYSFTDRTPLAGDNYYQLKQYDIDGKFTVSEVRLVSVGEINTAFAAYPNPTDGWITINHQLLTANAEVVVVDMQGRKQLTQPATKGESSTKVNLTALPKGLYMVSLVADGNKQVIKVVKR